MDSKTLSGWNGRSVFLVVVLLLANIYVGGYFALGKTQIDFVGDGGFMRVFPTRSIRLLYTPLISVESKIRGVTVTDGSASFNTWRRLTRQ